MTAQEYNALGYPVSLHIEQPIIDRAEADVHAAYIEPIAGTTHDSEQVVKDALAALSFLLMTQRNVFVTRSGAKEKTNANSRNADAWAGLQEQANTCAMRIDILREQPWANKRAGMNDICRIYFATNFYHV